MTDQARRAVDELEAQVGCALHEHSVGQVDQLGAAIRDLAAEVGADVADPEQARCMLTGAIVLLAMVSPMGMPLPHIRMAAHVMRALADRTEEAGPAPAPAPRRRWWRR